MAIVLALALPAGALAKRAPSRLRAFASCPEIVGYAQRHFRQTQGTPGGASSRWPSPPPGPNADRHLRPLGADASAGDGADLLDHERPGGGRRRARRRQDRRRDDLHRHRPDPLRGRGERPGGAANRRVAGARRQGGDLLLHGQRLLVIQTASPICRSSPWPARAPRLRSRRREPDAHHRGRRRRPGRAEGLPDAHARRPVRQRAPERRDRARRALFDAAGLRGARRAPPCIGWLPRSRFASRISGRHRTRTIVACRAVRRPPSFSGSGWSRSSPSTWTRAWGGRRRRGHDRRADGLRLGRHLYVATQRWIDPQTQRRRAADDLDAHPSLRRLRPRSHDLRGQRGGPGLLLNQYSLSEQGGDLRVASTDDPVWWQGAQESRQREPRDRPAPRRARRSPPIGRVGGLGKGERIYAVRFIGDVGYVVTFRQTDPLYTIDLTDPTRAEGPRRAEDPRLLGLPAPDRRRPAARRRPGRDARGPDQGRAGSLFDVGDPAHPQRSPSTRSARPPRRRPSSTRHAFLYWAPRQLVVLPLQVFDAGATSSSPGFTGAIALKVDGSGSPRPAASHTTPPTASSRRSPARSSSATSC